MAKLLIILTLNTFFLRMLSLPIFITIQLLTAGTILYAQKPKQREQAYFGDSSVAVTEFGPKVRAKVSFSYGNASQAEIKQYDQLKMMSDKQLRDALLDRTAVLQHLEEREVYLP